MGAAMWRVVSLLVLLAGCLPEPQYAVRRTAVVPHPAPPARSGQPLDGKVRLSGHHSTVLVPVAPEANGSANNGLYIARHNLGGQARFKVSPGWDLGFGHERSLRRGAMATDDQIARWPRGGAWTTTAGALFASPLDGSFRIALAVELGLVSASVREEGQCIANCDYVPPSYIEHGTRVVGLASSSIIPSYRAGNWVTFASATFRNHPTNTDKQRQGAWRDDSEDDLRAGPLYVLFGAGVEYRDPSGVTVLGHIYQPISTGVVQYGPAAGFSVAFELGALEP
jgi:hypothetical protein